MDVAELKQHLGEDLAIGDDALATLLDAAREAVDERLGPPGDVTEIFPARRRGPMLRLSRRALSIVSVVEGTTTLVSPTDYYLMPSGLVVMRAGSWWSWWQPLTITYTPVPDLALRESAYVALVKLDMTHSPGLVRQEIEGWSETYRIAGDVGNTYSQAREDILQSLRPMVQGIW